MPDTTPPDPRAAHGDAQPATPPAGPLADAPSALRAARAEIDAIDEAVHDLLMRRAGISARMAAMGMKAATGAFKPGREAQILRRLLARHRGPMPRALVARLWREIIASSLQQQSAFGIAAAVGVEELARGHFGLDAPVRVHPAAARALAALSSGDASVAVLPLPEDGEAREAAWWTALDAPRLRVVAALPFVLPPGAAAPRALVVAALTADPSGQDRTLLRFGRTPELSRGSLANALTAAGLPPARLLFSADGRLGLLETEGALEADDPRLRAMPELGLTPLGAYAVPEAAPSAPPQTSSPQTSSAQTSSAQTSPPANASP